MKSAITFLIILTVKLKHFYNSVILDVEKQNKKKPKQNYFLNFPLFTQYFRLAFSIMPGKQKHCRKKKKNRKLQVLNHKTSDKKCSHKEEKRKKQNKTAHASSENVDNSTKPPRHLEIGVFSSSSAHKVACSSIFNFEKIPDERMPPEDGTLPKY